MAVKKGNTARKSFSQEVQILRIFDAPRELVFKFWTEPERLMRWWGPKGYTIPCAHIDLKVGGEFFCCMKSPQGQDLWSKGIFKEIALSEKLVITDSFADKDGNIVPASYYGMSSEWAIEMLIKVTFHAFDGEKTKLVLKHTGIEGMSDIDRENMRKGWNESFDKLVSILKD